MVFDSEILVFFIGYNTIMLFHYSLCLLTIWVLTFCPKKIKSFCHQSLIAPFNGILYTFSVSTEEPSLPPSKPDLTVPSIVRGTSPSEIVTKGKTF